MPEIKEDELKEDKEVQDKGLDKHSDKIKTRKLYYEERYGKSLTFSKKDGAYARGDQWDEDTLKKMEDEEGNLIKPAVTQNLIKGHIAYLRGNQAQNRYYFKVLPADGVNAQEPIEYDGQQVNYDSLAKLLTDELKKIENENDGEYELDDCFHEAVAVSGRSNLTVVVEEDEETYPREKTLMFAHKRYDQSFADPDHNKYDLSDSKDHINISEMSRDDLIALMPGKEKVIKELTRNEEDLSSKEDKSDGNLRYNEPGQQISSSNKESDDLFLVEYYDYEWLKEYMLIMTIDENIPVDEATRMMQQEAIQGLTPGFEPRKFKEEQHSEIKTAVEGLTQQLPGVEYLIIPLKRKCWYVTFYVSGTVLQREKLMVNGVELRRLPFAEYACDRLKCVDEIHLRDLSVTRELIGTQDIHNKAVSQLIAHLASSIHSGIVAEQGVLIDKDNWENFGSSAGFVGEIKRGGFGKWQQMLPTPLSQGHAILTEIAQNIMPLISGVNPNLRAAEKSSESGKAKALQIRQGETTTNYIYDNFRRTKHVLCSILLEHICALKGLDFKKLKIVIDDAAESPTARYANWQEIREVLEATQGLQSPYGDMVIDMMNINNREEWKQRWTEITDLQGREQAIGQKEQQLEAQEAALIDAQKEIMGQ